MHPLGLLRTDTSDPRLGSRTARLRAPQLFHRTRLGNFLGFRDLFGQRRQYPRVQLPKETFDLCDAKLVVEYHQEVLAFKSHILIRMLQTMLQHLGNLIDRVTLILSLPIRRTVELIPKSFIVDG